MDEENYAEKALLSGIDKQILDAASKALDTTFDPSYWVLTELGLSLYDNQIEILENVVNLNTKYLAIIGARSSGKTFSVGVGLVKLCLDNPGLEVLVFAPKAFQSTRVLDEIFTKVLNEKNREKYLDLDKTIKTKLVFKNGSYIIAQSAAVETQGEGLHGDLLVVDESQRVPSLSFSQRMVPMLASSRIAKIIQLGVPLYKGHFWSAFQNKQYTKLAYTWLDCPKLFESGTLRIDGKDYPRFMVDQMSRDLKQKFFPDHQDLWYDSVTKMSSEDFRTQYIMEWLEDINLVLTEEDQIRLSSGIHPPLFREIVGDTYYFGLDFAGGSNVGESIKTDFTALSVWRKSLDGRKEKVFAAEWKGDLSSQWEEITSLIHPKNGLFRCKGGLADYGNMGAGIVDIMKRQGIQIDGVFFGAKDQQTGKNYKNAMYDHFVFELRNDRVLYPNIFIGGPKLYDQTHPSIRTLKKGFEEWCLIERHKGLGFNDKIFAPDDAHDDHCSADVMGLWAADRSGEGGLGWIDYKIPKGVKANSIFSGGKLIQNQPQTPGMPRKSGLFGWPGFEKRR